MCYLTYSMLYALQFLSCTMFCSFRLLLLLYGIFIEAFVRIFILEIYIILLGSRQTKIKTLLFFEIVSTVHLD